MAGRPKKTKAAQQVDKLEYSRHTTPTRKQITGVLTTLATTKSWIIKRTKEVHPMNSCHA